MAFTARQLRFVDEYLTDLNATQAAIRAGYSERTAASIGSENLTKPEIAAAIAVRQAERAAVSELNERWILDHLKENVERSMVAVPVMVFDHESKQMVETGTWEYEGAVANKALELIGVHRGMFVKRREISGLGGGPIEVRVRIEREGRRLTAKTP